MQSEYFEYCDHVAERPATCVDKLFSLKQAESTLRQMYMVR